MKYQTCSRIMRGVAKTAGRYSLPQPMIVAGPDGAVIAATDGRMAAVRPLEAIEPSPERVSFVLPDGVMPKPTMHAKGAVIDAGAESVAVQAHKPSGKPDGAAKIGKPDTNTVFPPISDVMPDGTGMVYASVRINPTLLHDAMIAAQGEDSPSVTLFVPVQVGAEPSETRGGGKGFFKAYPGAGKPITVIGHGANAGASLVMPIADGTKKDPATPGADLLSRGLELFRATK